jgi:hypothetical protein
MTQRRIGGWTAAMFVAMELTGFAQVRSSDSNIIEVITRATAQSQTFREMVETVNASDALVYVEQGICGHGVRACFTNVTKAGATRILWLRVDIRKNDVELIASIGHELRHAIEVIGNETVTSNAALHTFYQREGIVRGSGAFETAAAVKAGQLVRQEMQRGNAKRTPCRLSTCD